MEHGERECLYYFGCKHILWLEWIGYCSGFLLSDVVNQWEVNLSKKGKSCLPQQIDDPYNFSCYLRTTTSSPNLIEYPPIASLTPQLTTSEPHQSRLLSHHSHHHHHHHQHLWKRISPRSQQHCCPWNPRYLRAVATVWSLQSSLLCDSSHCWLLQTTSRFDSVWFRWCCYCGERCWLRIGLFGRLGGLWRGGWLGKMIETLPYQFIKLLATTFLVDQEKAGSAWGNHANQ